MHRIGLVLLDEGRVAYHRLTGLFDAQMRVLSSTLVRFVLVAVQVFDEVHLDFHQEFVSNEVLLVALRQELVQVGGQRAVTSP